MKFFFYGVLTVLLLALGCEYIAGDEPTKPAYNARGGHIPACGDLPPLVGDDC